jgi:hypothetical protein
VQQYARLSLKSGQKIDPTPFHRMMLGKSVDVGVRGILVEMLGDSDFYEPSWKFFQQDLKTYGQIMANAELGIEIRLAAASNISSFTGGLYLRLYHKCPALKKHPLNTNLRKRKCPDVALMLKEDPGQFTEEERARLKALMAAADLVVGKSLAILKSHGSRRARVLVYNITRGPYRMNLLRSPDLVAKAKALVEGL